jgi:probable HAF family extracellular repeat protein
MTCRSWSGIALAVILVGALAPVRPTRAQQASFTVTDLGTLGGDRSSAYGVNNAGQVVGTSTTADGATRGFVYDHIDTPAMSDIGTFGGRDSMAYAISDVGTVTGRAQDTQGTFRAFVAGRAIPLLDLTALDSAFEAPFSTGTGVSTRGDVVGYRQRHSDHMAARTRGFLYSDSTIVDLGTFGGEDAVLTAVNDVQTLVGFYSTESHADYASHRAFRVRRGGTAEDLGTLGGRLTTPTAINDRGRIVGFAQLPNGESRAFVSDGGPVTSLGTLPGGRQSFAYGVNAAGDVAGASEASDGSLHAVVYRGGQITDLNTLIAPTSGWRLTEARGINASGVIVGTGVNRGHQRAFKLTPILPR